MVAATAQDILVRFHDDRGDGAILFDAARQRQAGPELFDPEHWGEHARRVGQGGRGGAWFVEAGERELVLRRYLRGGWAARLSRDGYAWRGESHVRSFAEYRLLRELRQRGLAVPAPHAACYWRRGRTYRAAIMVERIAGARSLAELAAGQGSAAPWVAAGRLIAGFHREGLDHADLNAHNVLFDGGGAGWLIDLDRGRLRRLARSWRERNLARLLRSLRKLRGDRAVADVDADFTTLRIAYDQAWEQGA
ncbi:MAG: 3-deoxy-D-manno-octulosonic acid kinase [Thermomonas sp.]